MTKPKENPQFRRINWDAEPRLGKVSDYVLAAEYGCSRSAVTRARLRRGIIAESAMECGRGWANGINWDAESRLGQVPDSVLAAEHGCSISSVCHARRRRGIPSWLSQQKTQKDSEST